MCVLEIRTRFQRIQFQHEIVNLQYKTCLSPARTRLSLAINAFLCTQHDYVAHVLRTLHVRNLRGLLQRLQVLLHSVVRQSYGLSIFLAEKV